MFDLLANALPQVASMFGGAGAAKKPATPPPPPKPPAAKDGDPKPPGPSPHAGMFDEGTGGVVAGDASQGAAHPVVEKIKPPEGGDTSPKAHEQRVAETKAGVEGELKKMDDAKAKEIIETAGPTVLQALVIGGGTMGTLDAATYPTTDPKGVMGVSQGGDPWGGYGHMRVGQTGEQLEGRPEEGKPGLTGLTVQPKDLQQNPDEYLRSSELSLATAQTRLDAQVPVVPGKVIGGVEVRPPDADTTGWPPEAKAKTVIEVTLPDGSKKTETVYTTGTVDIAVGPGPDRRFSDTQLDDKKKGAEKWTTDADGNAQAPQVQYAMEYLSTPKDQAGTEGKDVLVFGGGDTAAWCTEAARQQGADSVTWAARPAKPDAKEPDPDNPGKMKMTKFGELEAEIAKKVQKGEDVPPEMGAQYREEIKKHGEKLLKHADDLDKEIKELEAAGGSPLDINRKIEERDKLKLQAEPHSVAKDRNKDTNAGTDANSQVALDVLKVDPQPDGRVKVTFADGSSRVVDKIVGAMGQEPQKPGGPVELLSKVDELVPIFEGDPPFPVGLSTPGGEVRVLGASAWQVRGKIKDPKIQAQYEKAIHDRSLSEVSKDSRGVVFGFENMGDNPARANAVLAEQLAAEGKLKPEEAAEKGATELASKDPASTTGAKSTPPPPPPAPVEEEKPKDTPPTA